MTFPSYRQPVNCGPNIKLKKKKFEIRHKLLNFCFKKNYVWCKKGLVPFMQQNFFFFGHIYYDNFSQDPNMVIVIKEFGKYTYLICLYFLLLLSRKKKRKKKHFTRGLTIMNILFRIYI